MRYHPHNKTPCARSEIGEASVKVIFLDIDGVIATPTSVRLNYLLGRGPQDQWYDGVALAYLGKIAKSTGAIVVLTSNWRLDLGQPNPLVSAIMDNLYAQLAAVGAPVADTTPHLPEHDRSVEVGAWLDEHPCEAYVIFDDLAPFNEQPEVAEGHLVLIEESDGIRWQHYRTALDVLAN